MTKSEETLRPDFSSIFSGDDALTNGQSCTFEKTASKGKALHAVQQDPVIKYPQPVRSSATRVSWWSRSADRFNGFFARERWTFEASSLLLSTIIVTIMAVVLRIFDRQPMTDWPLPITLNAFVSLLVTFLYMFLMVPTSSCLSQLKWNHFQREQSLYDFQKYDDASRGVFGAFKIIFSRKKSLLTWLFAILVIAISAIGPLTQQILQFATSEYPLPSASHNASLPIARSIDSSQYLPWGLNVQSDVYSAAYANQKSNFTVVPECSASNCTWPGFATFTVQHRTTDISDSIQRASQQDISELFSNVTALSSADGNAGNRTVLRLAEPFDKVNLTAGQIADSQFGCPSTSATHCLNGSNSSSFQLGDRYTTSMTYLQVSPAEATEEGDWHGLVVLYQELNLTGTYQPGGLANVSLTYGISKAWNFMFQFVVQPLQALQTNGKYTEIPAGDSIPFNITGSGGCQDNYNECVVFGITVDGAYFAAAADGLQQYAVYLDSLSGYAPMNGWLSNAGHMQLPEENDPKTNMMYGFLYSAFLQTREPEWVSGFVSQRWNLTLDDMMGNVARGMTSTFRTHSNDRVQGVAYTTATIYVISWKWISIPAVLLGLTVALTIATAVETRLKGMPTWTDSSLATIFLGIDEASRSEFLDMQTVEELERASKRLKVKIAEKEFNLCQVGPSNEKDDSPA